MQRLGEGKLYRKATVDDLWYGIRVIYVTVKGTVVVLLELNVHLLIDWP